MIINDQLAIRQLIDNYINNGISHNTHVLNNDLAIFNLDYYSLKILQGNNLRILFFQFIIADKFNTLSFSN